VQANDEKINELEGRIQMETERRRSVESKVDVLKLLVLICQ